jgi:imidazolonepropionase-like amidohydrolase
MPRAGLLPTVVFTLLSLATAASSQERTVAIVGATILPISGKPISNGTIVLHHGKIVAVGAKVGIPAGAKRIDGRGKTIIPGLVDARSSLFLSPDDLNTAGTADRDALDGADFFDENARKTLARGVTTAYLAPGRRGAITGVGAVVKLRSATGIASDDKPGYGRVLLSRAAVHATLGVSQTNRTTSLERLASYEALRSAFKAAQQYADSFARYDRALKRFEADQKSGATDPGDDPFAEEDPFGGFGQQSRGPQKPTKPRAVPAQEILAKALRREIPVRIEAHRTDDIMNALRLADEFGLKLILERATEGASVASEIAKRRAAVVWGPTLISGLPDVDTLKHDPETGGRLSHAGLRLAFSPQGETAAISRGLLENAAAAAGHGVSPTEALKAITLGAAEVIGVADRVGSLSVGKDADLVILSGNPWNPATKVVEVWVDGEAYRAK